MKSMERFNLINKIASELQSIMTTTDINTFLGGFDVEVNHGLRMANSKRVYVQELLTNEPDEVIIRIANELNLDHQFTVTSEQKVEESKFWEPGHFRLFLSHLSEFRKKTGLLQQKLKKYGILSFVAHADIEPTKKWQKEIEKALHSMDALATILMPGFKESDWTDQEVGFAVAKGKLVVPVMKGLNPYGFISKYQGFNAIGKSVSEVGRNLFEIISSHEKTGSKMMKNFIESIINSKDIKEVNTKLDIIEEYEGFPISHLKRLREKAGAYQVFTNNSDIKSRLNKLLESNSLDPIVSQDEEFDEGVEDVPF